MSKKAKEKLPEHQRHGAIFTRRSFEQCSSEALALYKSNRFSGNRLLILAGGLGIDDWAFSKSFKLIISIEPDNHLNDIALYNFNLMQVKHVVRETCKAETYLEKNQESFDLIYIDPDRRNSNKRQLLLQEHEPNIIELMPLLYQTSKNILIKCSPLYDFEMALRELSDVKEIISISKQGEMKEMLVLIDTARTEKPTIICCSDIQNDRTISHTFELSDQSFPEPAPQLEKYLYEAGASLIKMRKHHCYASFHHLGLIDKQIAFYSSKEKLENWMGRQFVILKSMPYQSGLCKTYLTLENITRANVKSRGLKFNSEEVKRKLGLQEGGQDFIFVIPFKGKAVFLHARVMN